MICPSISFRTLLIPFVIVAFTGCRTIAVYHPEKSNEAAYDDLLACQHQADFTVAESPPYIHCDRDQLIDACMKTKGYHIMKSSLSFAHEEDGS
ncbi:hypothetical protein [Desulfovibrio inopinatus]|uniref:hypothetical protein n=1 Tax=Desulfovibrio inopinatus TaxID=102109 RepID=UPI000484ECF5|nr:hypothetical protein [Desulfovibrio inopinatus]